MNPFDQIIPRHHTLSLKYDGAKERGKPDDAIPLWVADMDFQTAPEIIKSLEACVAHGIYGYSIPDSAYYQAVIHWFKDHHNLVIEPESIVLTPGIVYALACAIKACTAPNECILINAPVYYPFQEMIELNQRTMVNSPLIVQEGTYRVDFADFEQKIIDHQVKAYILCNPHNPVGRVWTLDELKTLVAICEKHQVYIISDDIHCDFTRPNHPHTFISTLAGTYRDHLITCTSPTKSFNLASLQVSNILIDDPELRRRFIHEVDASGYSQLNVMGLVATTTAYQQSYPWFASLWAYIQENIDYLDQTLKARCPAITLVQPEGTYLCWLDCRKLHLSTDALHDLFLNQARLWVDDGSMFGTEGEQFERMNVACPRATLEQALNQLIAAVEKHTNPLKDES